MNVIILGGFLGSGKTTLLRSLAEFLVKRLQKADEAVVAIIENEIGDVSIDDLTLSQGGYRVTTLFSGCICCTLTGELTASLAQLQSTDAPQYVIVEATGLAFPDAVAENLRTYGTGFASITTFVLADAERWEDNRCLLEVMNGNQMKGADHVFINKVDAAEEAAIQLAEQDVLALEPRAKLHRVSALLGIADELWEQVLGL